jgi:hypothetical protein
VPTTEEALERFFGRDWGLLSFNVYNWRYARIHVLRALTQTKLEPQFDQADAVVEAASRSTVGAFPLDFLPELLEFVWLREEAPGDLIEPALAHTAEPQAAGHVADALYRHFTRRESITRLDANVQNTLRQSGAMAPLCTIAAEGRQIPGRSDVLLGELETFCGSRAARR